jgi:hypothetical protein
MRIPALLLLPALLLPALPAAAQPRPPATFAEGISQDPATLLRLAESRLDAGQVAAVSELVERAESMILTRAELASEARSPARSEILAATAAARAALRADDRATAATQIALARARLSQLGIDSVAGDKLDAPVAPFAAVAPSTPAATAQPWSPVPVAKPAP